MSQELIVYGWECPICSQKKMSLTARDQPALEDLAKNNLLSHVRVTSGRGHGNKKELPPGFDPDVALEYVRFSDDIAGERPRDDVTLTP